MDDEWLYLYHWKGVSASGVYKLKMRSRMAPPGHSKGPAAIIDNGRQIVATMPAGGIECVLEVHNGIPMRGWVYVTTDRGVFMYETQPWETAHGRPGAGSTDP